MQGSLDRKLPVLSVCEAGDDDAFIEQNAVPDGVRKSVNGCLARVVNGDLICEGIAADAIGGVANGANEAIAETGVPLLVPVLGLGDVAVGEGGDPDGSAQGAG